MTNPFTGVLINGIYYNYVTGSYNRTYPFKIKNNEAQNSRVFSILPAAPPMHTIQLQLDNTYLIYDSLTNNASTGTTTWLGVSRLTYLVNTLSGLGSSMPITFVAPDGSTHLVVPSGVLDAQPFNPDNVNQAGFEWRVNLTLINTQ